jgi:hypothetical protein
MGMVTLTGDRQSDVATILSRCGEIRQAYQADIDRNEKALVESYGPLLDAIDGVSYGNP